jgi:hypothetical protein
MISGSTLLSRLDSFCTFDHAFILILKSDKNLFVSRDRDLIHCGRARVATSDYIGHVVQTGV